MKHIIWTNDLDYNDWKESLEVEYPGLTEDQRINLMYEMNDEDYCEEQSLLDKELPGEIVMCGTLGLWNGTKTGYKFLKERNLNAVMSGQCGDYTTWYVEDGEVKCKDVHHDGTNYYTYRMLNGIDAYDFEEYVCDYSLKAAVEKYTKPLGNYVAEIFGW